MSNTRSRASIALCAVALGLSAGCTWLPGFLKGTQSASPAPSEAPASDANDSQEIVGQVGSASQTPEPTASPQAPMTATVHIASMAFSPDQVTIAQGGSVTFVNDDAVPHSVVPRSGAQFTGSQTFGTGQQVTLTFAQAGDQPYVCGVHPSMTGTVTVQAP